MLQHYGSLKEKARFIERLESLLLEGFETEKRVKNDETQEHQTGDALDKKSTKSTFFLSKAEKEQIQKERKEAEERHVKALGMLQDAIKLNRVIVADIDENPRQYITLLKRKIFNPHKCNIARAASSRMVYGRNWKDGNLSLLYSILSNWIKDENMTIMECDSIYQKFGFSCQVIDDASPAQEILFRLYEHIKGEDSSLLQGPELRYVDVPPNERFAKLFVEYLDYDWDNSYNIWNMWESMSLEEIVEKGRNGIGPVKRTKIPWETRCREIYHTIMGGEFEEYREPAPEKIRYTYLNRFEELLKLNVHTGRDCGAKYIDGIQIGFILFMDEYDIKDLPIDWEKVEYWTKEEETEFRRREEEERKAKEVSDRFLEEMLKKRKRRYGKEDR